MGCGQEVTPNSADTPAASDDECIPIAEAEPLPATASAYADLCEPYVGVTPTVDCGDGVAVPIYVDGVEVFDEPASCDNPDFKGSCPVGSRVGREQGVAVDGSAMSDVVWAWFCRSQGPESLETGIASVQMIGGECSSCHQSDPFIHTPWIDQARLPDDPSQPVLPEVAGPESPYWVVGGADWDRRTVHIEGNGCVSCHRAPDPSRILAYNGEDVNDFMPPPDPGSLSADHAEIATCYAARPDQTEDCAWVSPPDPYCEDADSSDDDTTDTGKDTAADDDEECPDDFDPTEPCTNGDKCFLDGTWWVCENGAWTAY